MDVFAGQAGAEAERDARPGVAALDALVEPGSRGCSTRRATAFKARRRPSKGPVPF